MYVYIHPFHTLRPDFAYRRSASIQLWVIESGFQVVFVKTRQSTSAELGLFDQVLYSPRNGISTRLLGLHAGHSTH